MAATLHFVTGKGGVGKSTLAAALTLYLTKKNEGPVLLLDVQGSGRALEILGLKEKSFENKSLPGASGAWGARILPRESFKQYFALLLALGSQDSALALATSELRRRLVDLVLENRVVSAFVDVCPGLEPAVLLGKVHWEATHGKMPDSFENWKHIVVDAPATGHGLMLFRSTFALAEVFGAGAIFKQAISILNFIRDPSCTKIHIASIPEELPLQESLEMKTELKKMLLSPASFLINRTFSTSDLESLAAQGGGEANLESTLESSWKEEIQKERGNLKESKKLLEDFINRAGQETPIFYFQETASTEKSDFGQKLCEAFKAQQFLEKI